MLRTSLPLFGRIIPIQTLSIANFKEVSHKGLTMKVCIYQSFRDNTVNVRSVYRNNIIETEIDLAYLDKMPVGYVEHHAAKLHRKAYDGQ